MPLPGVPCADHNSGRRRTRGQLRNGHPQGMVEHAQRVAPDQPLPGPVCLYCNRRQCNSLRRSTPAAHPCIYLMAQGAGAANKGAKAQRGTGRNNMGGGGGGGVMDLFAGMSPFPKGK
mgnify:CR=1 FL=1